MKWYGWNIEFKQVPRPNQSRKTIKNGTITVEIKFRNPTDEDKYQAANLAIKILIEDKSLPSSSSSSLKPIVAEPHGEPVVLYQESSITPGRPKIEFDYERNFYIVRMTSAKLLTNLSEPLGDVDYRMNPLEYARSFSILIYYKQLPVPLEDKELVYPVLYDIEKNFASLLNLFHPTERTAIDASRIAFLQSGRGDGSWIRFMHEYGFWEIIGVEFLLNNRPTGRTVEGYLKSKLGWNGDYEIGLRDLSLVGTAAIEIRPIAGGKGFGAFSTRKILEGTWIEEYVGDVLTTAIDEEVDSYFVADLESVLAPKTVRKLIIDGGKSGGLSRFFNHTCYNTIEEEEEEEEKEGEEKEEKADVNNNNKYKAPGPNADLFAVWLQMPQEKKGERKVLIRVMRTVEKGEEMTVNYGTEYEIKRCLCEICKISKQSKKKINI